MSNYGGFDDGKGYTTSYEDFEKYHEFSHIDKDGKPVFKVKAEYRTGKVEKATNTGLAIIFKLFGL